MPVRFVPATVLAMACSACTPGSTDRAVAESATATASEAVPGAPQPSPAAITSLTGEWRVAGIDDRPFDEPYALALSGDERELWWEPRCAFHIRSYRISAGAVTFSAPMATGPRPTMPPPVCLIAPPARLGEVLRALDAAQTIARTAKNGVRITGGEHSLLLFSQ
jgi:hypothetical protein